MQLKIEWPTKYAAAAALLSKAANFAAECHRPEWDFAVEISELCRLGLSGADLRWLVCQGFLVHSAELSDGNSEHRKFQPTGKLRFDPDTCFLLTRLGQNAVAALRSTCSANNGHATPLSEEMARNGEDAVIPNLSTLKPIWNPQLLRLSLGQLTIKEFKTPARNQQLVLAAFQEEGWPPRIDDPLPPTGEIEPKRRLHETISALNRHQVNRVMRFAGDGSGHGVRWFSIDAPSLLVTRSGKAFSHRLPTDQG